MDLTTFDCILRDLAIALIEKPFFCSHIVFHMEAGLLDRCMYYMWIRERYGVVPFSRWMLI